MNEICYSYIRKEVNDMKSMTYEEIMKEYDMNPWQVDGFYRREVVQLTQTELGQLTGFKQPVLAAYESGKQNRPSTHEAYKEIGVEGWVVYMWRLCDPGEEFPLRGIEFIVDILNHKDILWLHKNNPELYPIRKEWDNGEQTAAEERGSAE